MGAGIWLNWSDGPCQGKISVIVGDDGLDRLSNDADISIVPVKVGQSTETW